MRQINTWPGWECVRQLGAGAFGKVYEIQREENGKLYKAALKVISIPQNEADIENAYSEGMDKRAVTEYFQSFVTDFTNEIALMSDLKGYTNIVSYEDHMVLPHEGGVGWDILIRMELLTPLVKWTMDHPMDEETVIRMGGDLCRALILCHKNKIIHRDIKPENIFVNKNGDFKLGDFGIARVVEKTVSVMSQKGTYTYMAPEVFKGKSYDETADLYSLGIVLYRFLNENRTPFLPMGNLQYTDRQIAQDRRMKGNLIPAPKNGSNELKFLVLKALQYDSDKRFQSAKEMKEALDHCQKEKKEVQSVKILSVGRNCVQSEETVSEKKIEKATEKNFQNEIQEEEKTVLNLQSAPKKKKKKWLIPTAVFSVLVLAGIVALMLFTKKTDNLIMIEFNESLMQYEGMTYAQYKNNTGKKAEWVRGEIYGELPNTDLKIVFQASPETALLIKEQRCLRLEGRLGDFLNLTGITAEGIYFLDFSKYCKNEVEIEDVKIGDYAGEYTISDEYIVYELFLDDNKQTKVELHVDMSENDESMIHANTKAWLVF